MQTFNPKNGQIYTETTSSSAKSMLSSAWKKRVTGRVIDPRAARNVKGADSLQEMAMRVCCWNVDLFMPEALAYPGWEHASRVYKRLKSRDALSLGAWMLFQEAYPNQPGQLCEGRGDGPTARVSSMADLPTELSHHFRLEMHDVVTCWSSIVRSLGSLDTSVLTHFCANGLNLDLAKLMSLAGIPTLTALIHVNSSQRQTHPLRGNAIRDWCRAVQEKNAFLKLKLLYMTSIPDEGPSDNTVLDHLSRFPALVVVGIERTSSHPQINNSEKFGQWQRSNPAREHKLNTTMHDAKVSIAEKTKRIYKYACKVSEPPRTEEEHRTSDVATLHASTDTHSQPQSHGLPHPVQIQSREAPEEQPILLTLSCYAPQNTRYVGSATWFVRKHDQHYLPEKTSKRTLDIKDSRDDGGRSTKNRKIRQGKQHDVGSLLELFGPPRATGAES